MTLSSFGLTDWPFALIPDAERGRLWAGRPELKRQMLALVRSWSLRRASEIDLFWAEWGQGKTHTLYYLQNHISQDPSTIVHYVQLPSLAGVGQPFKALYNQIMLNFPLHVIANKVYEGFEPGNNMVQLFSPAVGQAWPAHVLQLLWLMKTKGPGSYIAEKYLRGQKVSARELSELKIGNRTIQVPPAPRSAQDCQNTLSDIIKVAINYPRASGAQCVFLIDEFQHIGSLKSDKMKQVCDSLHLVYNSNPHRLRFVLAFATGDPNVLPLLMGGALLSRVTNTLALPAPTREDVVLYVQELLASFCRDSERPEFTPFQPEAARALCNYAYDASDGYCTLRKINLVFDKCFFWIIERRSERYESTGGENAANLVSHDEVVNAIKALDPAIRAALSADLEEAR